MSVRVDVLAVLLGRVLGDDLRPAIGRLLVHVDLGRPVHRRIVLLGDQQLAGGAVERVAEAVAVEVDEQSCAVLPSTSMVGEDHLVDAVIVPLVVGRHLVDPLGHAGVGVAGEDGHRPVIVAGPLHRVPGRGIARAVVDEVQLRDRRSTSPRWCRRRSSTGRLPRSPCRNPCRPACRDGWSSPGRSGSRSSGPIE